MSNTVAFELQYVADATPVLEGCFVCNIVLYTSLNPSWETGPVLMLNGQVHRA